MKTVQIKKTILLTLCSFVTISYLFYRPIIVFNDIHQTSNRWLVLHKETIKYQKCFVCVLIGRVTVTAGAGTKGKKVLLPLIQLR